MRMLLKACSRWLICKKSESSNLFYVPAASYLLKKVCLVLAIVCHYLHRVMGQGGF